MVRDRAMRDDVGFGPLPVVSHSGVFDGSGASAGRLACVLALAGLLCVSSSQGQVIREEGFPVKGGVPEESAWAPVVREECDPFTVPGEFGESCAPREKTPDPFGFGPEGEARPGEPSGPAWRTPPRLECPVAIFLEELETGAIECYAWDASGEEHLEYSWEPVGSTTRDYLNNPRLIPEDAPNPSVVAPEAPVYEMLESFRSGGTTFLYRYRLTATSRATGLFSHEEVEVYVSGSRPSVYCPLEVAVEEGETVSLDCEGVDPLSHRMDYDEDGASILWEWEGLWGTSTSLLDATDLSSALFTAPAGSAGEEYHYIASMTSQASGTPRTARRRVSVRVVGKEEVSGHMPDPDITCSGNPYEVWEGSSNLSFSCLDSNTPGGNQWVRWSPRGEQTVPPVPVAPTPRLSPWYYEAIFDVPDVVDQNEVYEYTVALYGHDRTAVFNAIGLLASEDVTITVLNKPSITVTCEDIDDVDEGAAGIEFDCSASGAPGDDPDYTWSWYLTTNLTDHNTATPTFAAPDNVDQETTYTYTVTASAENAEDGTAEVTVTVLDTDTTTPPSITCSDSPYEVYEGASDLRVNCSVHEEPRGTNNWVRWSRRGEQTVPPAPVAPTPRLKNQWYYKITFDVPDLVNQVEMYEYTVALYTAPSNGTIVYTLRASADVTVTVKNKPAITVTCEDIDDVDEGADDIEFDCSASGAPGDDPDYTWSWSPTTNLTGHNTATPTFDAPDDVDRNTTYTYTVTASAENADDGTAEVTVTVLDTDTGVPSLAVACQAAGLTLDTSGIVIAFHTSDSGMFIGIWERMPDLHFACEVTDAPENASYVWSWTASTGMTDLALLSDDDISNPVFDVPDIDGDERHEYIVTATSDVGETGEFLVDIQVKEQYDILVTCTETAYDVTEGAGDFAFDCRSYGGFFPPHYWSWSPTDRLTDHYTGTPTFDVPEDVDRDTTYVYTATITAGYTDAGQASVEVTVQDTDTYPPETPGISCIDPDPVYEGTADITLDCSAANEPSDATYSWVSLGDAADANLLSSTTVLKPVFAVPDDIDEPGGANRVYEYTVTLSASGVADVTEDVTVTVLNKPAIDVDCADNPYEVYEGSGYTTLDCSASGAPSGSDYDYVWTALGSTANTSGTSRLSATDISSPTFRAPPAISRWRTYEYRLTVSADNAEPATADVTVTVVDRGLPGELVCDEIFFERYAGSDNIELSCRLSSRPGGVFRWLWAAWSADGPFQTISSTGGWPPGWPRPHGLTVTGYGSATFRMPATVNSPTTYKYTLGVWRGRCPGGCAPQTLNLFASQDITIRVLKRPAITVTCADSEVYEGSADIELECSASGAPGDDPQYTWSWSPTTRLADHDTETPTFDVPYDVPQDTTYTYTVTASAENAEDGRDEVTVTVLHTDVPRSVVTCNDTAVYEATADITLDCTVTNEPSDAAYSWATRGSTSDTNNLSSTAILAPTFDVPDNVDANTDYDYAVTLSASGVADVTEDITVTVLNRSVITVTCEDPDSVYEGVADFAFACAASGAPGGSAYEYEWTARNSTANTDLLIAGADGPAPTFDVPEEVEKDETYEYTLTVSADNAESVSEGVTVRVLNKKTLDVACATPSPVYEGSEDFALDCAASGAPAGSAYEYEWTARNSTANTDLLIAGADGPAPTFDVPEEVDEDETYEYLLTVSAENAESASADVTVKVLNKGALSVACATPSPVYEGSEDFALDCAASGAPGGSGYTYVWTDRGATANTNLLIAGADGPAPTFDVPEEVDEDETYEYLLTVSAENAVDATAEVTVKVLNLGSVALVCASPPLVYEGSEDFALDCSVSGDTGDNVDYAYEWAAIGVTPNTSRLSAADISSPTFYVPDALDETTTYEYLLTARAENVEDAKAEVTVTVLNRGALALVCTAPGSVYEGSADLALDCAASGAPAGSEYTYEWTGRGSTTDTALLSAADGPAPTFDVPEEVDETTTYKYLLTVSAENAESASAEVTVTVLNRGALALVCTDPGSVYEGSEDFALDCAASGAPGGSGYTYVWTDRGATANTDRLISGADGPAPTFDVPEEVDEDETYEYLLTVSAENAESATAEVTVTVLNRGALSVACATPSPVYEGSEDFALDCSVSGDTGDVDYAYEWAARGATPNTARLSAVDISSPTFYVPEEVDETTTYKYLLTVSAENAESATAEVTVTVLNLGSIALVCASPPLVYEGSADIAFDCSASGAPGDDPQYTYAWTARGSTANTDLLISGTDGPTPTFAVLDEVDEDETYEYLLTASAENAEDALVEVTVTVLNKGALAVACADPGSVYEGSADLALDCAASGAPGGSEYTYVWTGRGSTTDTALLSAADGPAPTFAVPEEVDEDETYEYLLTASAENAEDATAEVTVTVLNKGALAVVCADPGSVYEGSADIAFDCSASGAPGDDPQYTYAWTARGSTANTDLLISGTDGPTPTFAVPDEVDETTRYEYLLTVSAENAEDALVEVTVTVLNKGALAVVCADPGSVYEGSADIAFDCSASGAPGDDPQYTYAWTARGDTPDTALLSAVDVSSPMFYVPDEVDEDETYEYLLTVSSDNAEDAAAEVTVTVLNKEALAVVCADPGSVYEGSADIAFDCSASGAPGDDPQYTYAWTARGSTANTDLLISGTDGPTPTFAVPDEVDEDETYEYLLTASADNAEDALVEVTVTVLNKGALAVACADPGSVYEGSADLALDCAASGAPGGSEYTYVWTGRGSTTDTALLSAADGPAPTFAVPEEVDEDETYEYLLTASAENAEDATAEVTVTVLNKGALAVVCADPGSVYEGSADIAFDCSASGAPGDDPQYTYAWTARGSTANTDLLISGTDGPTPTFAVPDEVDETTRYEYLLTVSAENAEDALVEVTVTVLNKGALAVVCADPGSVYEGSADIAFDCSASGAPGDDPQYTYAWTARGDTPDTALLSAVDVSSPMFYVPDEVDEDETYEYLLTVSSDNAEDAAAEVTVTVLNKEALAVVCADPGSVYEGSADIAFDCSASGAPGDDPQYTYAWTARGSTANTDLLISGTDGPTPTFAVPDEVDEDETYEYLLTASAENAEDATAEVTVTVLNKGALAVVCADPGSVYEGSADIAFDCSASGAPGDDPQYTYAWTARGSTANTDLLISGTDGPTPTFAVPDEVDEDETYEYLLTASADNAEDATADITVTVLDRIKTPDPEPVSPPVDSPSPVASSSAREPSEPSALGVTVSASPLRFGVQSSQTQVSLDPLTDGISTRVSGPYHAGRMTLSPGGGASFDENGDMDLSIEVISPVLLKREDAAEPSSLVLSPSWSFAESCEQLSSQAIGGLYTEATLTEGACRLLRFGGELDLTDAPSGRYAGSMDIVLRSGESEETHSVEVDVTVVPAQRVITIGPGGVRFGTSREVPAGLTEEQNLSIYPDVAFLTEEKPNGVFELSNPSLVPLEVSVSARFGYTEATENGREVVVEDASGSHLGDLSQVVDIHPNVLVLQPGEKGLVRYGMQEGALAAMAEKGYAAFFDVMSEPRQYVRTDRMPEEVAGDRTARVTMRVPGVYVPGEGASQLRAALLSISYVGSLSATFLLETRDHPFAGEVLAYDGDGRELGRRETLVYTRSRVRIPLDRMPEEGTVFLRFMPRGSGRVPEPVSVEWDALHRNIGAAEDKDRTRIPETLVQRP